MYTARNYDVYLFVIPHSLLQKRPQTMPRLKSLSTASRLRPKSSDSNLRGRYQTLPPIGSTEESYEEWKRKYVYD